MSSVTYNGVTLPFHRTLSHTARNADSPDGGGDVLYTEREFAYEGVLTPDVPGLVRPGETFAAAVRRVEALLRQTRKPLYVFMDGLHLRVDASTDVKNGPIPGVVSLLNIAGTQACTLRFTVKCHTPVCDGRGVYPQWVAHRWSESLDIDPETWAKTWTRETVLHIRPGEWNADAYRGVVTPPIRAGFLRTTARYKLAEDGLSLRATFTDKEQYVMPPPGAISIKGHCNVASNMGMFQFAEVTVRLTGSIVADKYRLFQTATVVAARKLRDMGVIEDTAGQMILQGAHRTKLEANEVEVYFRGKIAPPKNNSVAVLNATGQFIGGAAVAVSPALAGLDLFNKLTKSQMKPGDKPKDGQLPLPKVFDPIQGLTRMPYGFDSAPPDPWYGGLGVSLIAAALQDPCIAPPAITSVGGSGRLITDPNATGAGSDLPKTDPKNEKELKGDGGGRAATSEPVAVAGSKGAFMSVPQLVVPETPPGFMWPTPEVQVVSRAVFDAEEVSETRPVLSALYEHYELEQMVRRKSGKVGLTEQRAGGLTHFVQVSAPSVTILLNWMGERAGGKVAAPDVEGWGDNYVVLDHEDDGDGKLEVAADGVTMVNKRSGWILIGVADPSKMHLGASIAPWVAELLGREPIPLAGPDGPPADPEEFRRWRDKAGQTGTGELRTG